MKIIHSFYFAFNGIKLCFKSERNFRVHCIATIIVVTLGILFNISNTEWVMILLCIAFVLCLEIINTAIEKLCDVVQPEKHPMIKIIKDMSAAAVLIGAVISVIIGAIIFFPQIFNV